MIDAFELMLGDYVNCVAKNGATRPVIVDAIRNDLIRRQVDMYEYFKLDAPTYIMCGFDENEYGHLLYRDFVYFPDTGLFYKNVLIDNQPRTLNQLQSIVRVLTGCELTINFNND